LNIRANELFVRRYSRQEEQTAIDKYAELEKQYAQNRDFDVVLTGVERALDLKKAYPNYYADMGEFTEKVENIVKNA
jgi:hypothetical protein